MRCVVVSLAWGGKYRALVPRLEASLVAHGFPLRRILVRDGEPASRQEAWRLRPRMILAALEELGLPVLHLDVDAVIHGRPRRIEGLLESEADFALLKHDARDWRCGVLLTLPTERAGRALRRWDALLSGEGWENDEPAFRASCEETRAAVESLPPEYAWCRAWNYAGRWGRLTPVIEVNA